VKFDVAVELFFKCPNCKGSLNMIDNTKIKEALRHKIDQVTTDINSNKR
jgi:transcription initiation factor TFIIE subunit alpha